MLVYRISHIETGRSYIGITCKALATRWCQHKSASRAASPKCSLHRALKKHGPNAFHVEVAYEAVDDLEAQAVERALIAAHGTLSPRGYNLTIGGRYGGRPAPEVIARIKAHKRPISAILATANARRGMRHTDETKRLMAGNRRGKGLLNRAAAILTIREVAEIKSLLLNYKIRQSSVGALYGVHQSTISDIRTGRKWAEVEPLFK